MVTLIIDQTTLPSMLSRFSLLTKASPTINREELICSLIPTTFSLFFFSIWVQIIPINRCLPTSYFAIQISKLKQNFSSITCLRFIYIFILWFLFLSDCFAPYMTLYSPDTTIDVYIIFDQSLCHQRVYFQIDCLLCSSNRRVESSCFILESLWLKVSLA